MLASLKSRLLLLGLAAGLLGACGENLVGKIPESEDAAVTGYPKGPYGTDPGEVIANLSFEGYDRTTSSTATWGALDLASLYKKEGFRYLLINVAAEWCGACRVEAAELPKLYPAWKAKGGELITVIAQTSAGDVAQKPHLDAWAKLYHTNFTLVADPKALISASFSVNVLPLNLIIDLDTMKILKKKVGEDPQFVDAFDALLNP